MKKSVKKKSRVIDTDGSQARHHADFAGSESRSGEVSLIWLNIAPSAKTAGL